MPTPAMPCIAARPSPWCVRAWGMPAWSPPRAISTPVPATAPGCICRCRVGCGRRAIRGSDLSHPPAVRIRPGYGSSRHHQRGDRHAGCRATWRRESGACVMPYIGTAVAIVCQRQPFLRYLCSAILSLSHVELVRSQRDMLDAVMRDVRGQNGQFSGLR